MNSIQEELPFEEPERHHVRLSNSLVQLIPNSIKKFCGTEDVRWDFSIQAQPTYDTNDIVSYVVIYLEIAGLKPNTRVSNSWMFSPIAVSPTTVDAVVKNGLHQLKLLKSQTLDMVESEVLS